VEAETLTVPPSPRPLASAAMLPPPTIESAPARTRMSPP
jgi:hypothetical protein